MPMTSGITGFTLPGMIEDPGCMAGRLISARQARGPEAKRIRSLEILASLIAVLFNAEEYTTNACWSHVAVNMSSARTIGLPVNLARWAAHLLSYPLGTLMPDPMAVAPM